MSVLRLAIPSPLRQAFDYLPPENCTDAQLGSLQAGIRVLVPFGSREVIGILLEVVPASDIALDKLRSATAILDQEALVSSELMQLCQWAADYYRHPLGEVLPAALPASLRKGEAHKSQGESAWRLTTEGRGLPPGALSRAKKQAAALALLQAADAVSDEALQAREISRAVLRELEKKTLVESCTIPPVAMTPRARDALTLNEEQAAALAAVDAHWGKYASFLLEGVTGSGKTEVYLQLIDRCLQQGRQALVLIPEIGLTPQTLNRFSERFEARLAVMHSGLSEGERYRAWEMARTGAAHIVIGTRSAVFAPLPRPGLIIVDEEHDRSFKQSDGFRYSARDVAIVRARTSGVPIVLGSATPALESIANTESGRSTLLTLKQRASGGALPPIETLDLRRAPLQSGFSEPLLQTIRDTLSRKQQVLLFLNRRGYAPQLQCHDCGWIADCHHCDARMTVHRAQRNLRCHHCNASMRLPRTCPQCRSGALATSGLGTEQVAEYLRTAFPETAVHRVDSDVVRGRQAMSDLVDSVSAGGPCILLGTQMLAKGHHFPQVALVGILDTDTSLFSTDFRGEERMAQLLTQVAGRAGRADVPGRVLLQTHYPDHPTVQALITQPYADYARTLLAQRRESGMPPAGFLALIHADTGKAGAGEQFLHHLRRQVGLPAECALVGPLPAPLPRRAGKFRNHLVLRSTSRPALQHALGELVAQASAMKTPGDLRWSVDVDPQDAF